jgi:hypothetical protein
LRPPEAGLVPVLGQGSAAGAIRESSQARTRPPRLAVVATHPVQYHSPLFRTLSTRRRIELRVFYGWEGLATRPGRDPGFGQNVAWDIPLLDGYEWTQLKNDSRDPGPHHFGGIASRDLVPEVERWRPDAVLVIGWLR